MKSSEANPSNSTRLIPSNHSDQNSDNEYTINIRDDASSLSSDGYHSKKSNSSNSTAENLKNIAAKKKNSLSYDEEDIERQDSEISSSDSKDSLLKVPRSNPPLTFTQEIANQIRKGVTFTTNVVSESVGVSELIGVRDAPQLSNAVLDLVSAAQKVKFDQEEQLKSATQDASIQTTKSLKQSISHSELVWPFLKSEKLKEFCETASERNSILEIPRSISSLVDQLKIMSFNVGLLEYRLGGITWFCNPPFTKRRLQHLALALREVDCDFIALQEVYQEWQSDYLLEALRIKFPFVGRRVSGNFISLHNGLLTLSRFPILKTAYYPFKSVTMIERIFGSKGMLETTVDIPSVGQVTFVNIHLASGAVDPESSAIELLRNEEIEEVLEICDQAVIRGEIPVIIGDLNAAPNLCPSNYRNLCEKGFQDAFLAAKREKSINPMVELEELDKIWEDYRNLKIKKYRKRRRLKSKFQRKPSCPQRRSERIRNYFRRKCQSENNISKMKSRPEIRVSSDTIMYDEKTKKTAKKLQFNEKQRSVIKVSGSNTVNSNWNVENEARGDSTLKQKFTNRFSNYSFNELAHKASNFFNNALRQLTYKDLSRKGDPFCTMYFTWDPKNPLNAIGPHADCHGLRCDHLFLPPKNCAKELANFRPVKADILFDEPLVAVRSSWCGIGGRISLLTLSDHYAIRIVLQRN